MFDYRETPQKVMFFFIFRLASNLSAPQSITAAR